MKTKHIFGILAVLMVCSIFSISQGAGRFYYGTYGGWPQSDFGSIRDSLKFNIVYEDDVGVSNVHYWVEHSLRAIVANSQDENSPYTWATKSHYTLWEPERYQESYYHLAYSGGDLVSDASASSGKAMRFLPPDIPRLIQTGPGYPQEFERFAGDTIGYEYTAEFRLKSPLYFPSAKSGSGPAKLCSLAVVGNGQVLAHSMVYEQDFNYNNSYKLFKVQ